MDKTFLKVSMVALATIVIAVLSILTRDFIIKSKIEDRLSQLNIRANQIECRGLINIECNLKDITITNLPFIRSFNIYAKSVNFDNPMTLHKIDRKKRIEIGDKFNIFIKDIKFISKDRRYKVDITDYLNIKKREENSVIFDFKNSEINVSRVKNGYFISTDISHQEIKNILYAIYKLEFLELKLSDNDAIAMGANISLGVYSNDIIPKDIFFKKSLPLSIEYLSSEIVSRDWFIENDKNSTLTQILNDILTSNKKHKYLIPFK